MNITNRTSIMLKREEVIEAIDEYLQGRVNAELPNKVGSSMVEFRTNADGLNCVVVSWVN